MEIGEKGGEVDTEVDIEAIHKGTVPLLLTEEKL